MSGLLYQFSQKLVDTAFLNGLNFVDCTNWAELKVLGLGLYCVASGVKVDNNTKGKQQ